MEINKKISLIVMFVTTFNLAMAAQHLPQSLEGSYDLSTATRGECPDRIGIAAGKHYVKIKNASNSCKVKWEILNIGMGRYREIRGGGLWPNIYKAKVGISGNFVFEKEKSGFLSFFNSWSKTIEIRADGNDYISVNTWNAKCEYKKTEEKYCW